MEKKKKHQKVVTPSQEPDSNDLLSKEEQNQSNEALAAKNTKTGSPSEENLSSLNEQYPHILQWTCTTQHAAEQSSLNPRPCAPSLVSRWQQVAPLQPNTPNHPILQGQPTLHLAQSTTPFWLPQRHSYHFPAVSVPATFQSFTSIPTVDASWQPSAITGGTISRSQQQVPNLCYHFGPYPGFPGPWDPSSWCAHGQQSQPSFNYTSPGGFGYFSSAPPAMPNCSATFGESSQRGIIRPTTKLSQKHQQLWEAQSVENVQLWSVIGQLQSEIADYKSRLIKLEAEISSLKPSVDEPAAQVIRTGLSGAASKRGRPKRSVASVDVSASPDESHPRARARKPAAGKVQPEARVLVFEKVALNKLEDRQKTVQSISSTQKDNGEKIPFVMTNSSVNLEVNGSNLPMPAFNNQVHQGGNGIQICGIDTNSSLQMKSSGDKVGESKAAVSILSQQPKENNKVASITHLGGTNVETLSWPVSVHPEDQPRRSIHNTISQSFYDNGCVIRQAGKLIPSWSFVNEEDASDELEDAVVGSAKDENEEEVGDDVSSEAEEIAQTKDQVAYKMDTAVGTSPKDLPQYDNW
ncbi:uncharacterized protein LOC110409667 [Herrania umbratica]|uniref:Uncharacterized protein LOC110409667 n=1 Tax=Herrania umbratica TaxID=108875 RepID=A0A6J0ZIT3_9ROSI|nr:uncharacterized protein LOC110409667 [Herrania umbratica]